MDQNTKKNLFFNYLDYRALELEDFKNIVSIAGDMATHSELKQEGKYDTRRIEASYLAGAQKARLMTMEADLNLLKAFAEHINTSREHDEVKVGSLVKFKFFSTKNEKWVFILPGQAYPDYQFEGHSIDILSPNSPLVSAALGLEKDDDFEFLSPKGEIHSLVEEVL